MTGAISEYVLGLCASGALCALALALCPEGRVRAVLKLICGVVMTLALLSPLIKLDYAAYSRALWAFGESGAALSEQGRDTAESLSRTIIQERCAAYILDKARTLGVTLSRAEVELRWSADGCWYPVAATLYGDGSDTALTDALAAELGIAPERQTWVTEGG